MSDSNTIKNDHLDANEETMFERILASIDDDSVTRVYVEMTLVVSVRPEEWQSAGYDTLAKYVDDIVFTQYMIPGEVHEVETADLADPRTHEYLPAGSVGGFCGVCGKAKVDHEE